MTAPKPCPYCAYNRQSLRHAIAKAERRRAQHVPPDLATIQHLQAECRNCTHCAGTGRATSMTEV